MTRPLLGPLEAGGVVPAMQQTRLGAFLVSAYGALARGATLSSVWLPGPAALALQQQGVAAAGLVGTLMRAVAWQPDPWCLLRAPKWEMAWWPRPAPGVPAGTDALALGLAIVTVARPLPLLPPDADPEQAFGTALGLIELESGRLLQPNLRLLKHMARDTPRSAIEAVVEARRAQVLALWSELLVNCTAGP